MLSGGQDVAARTLNESQPASVNVDDQSCSGVHEFCYGISDIMGSIGVHAELGVQFAHAVALCAIVCDMLKNHRGDGIRPWGP